MPQFSFSSLGWFQRLCRNVRNVHYLSWLLLLMIIILFKNKQKREHVLSMDLFYAHIGVRCGNTVIYCCLFLANVVGQLFSFRVKCHKFEKNQTKKKQKTNTHTHIKKKKLLQRLRGLFAFNSPQTDSHRKMWKLKIAPVNNRPHIQSLRARPPQKRMPYRQLTNRSLSSSAKKQNKKHDRIESGTDLRARF